MTALDNTSRGIDPLRGAIALTIAMALGKIIGVHDWAWLWVTSPIWVPMAIGSVMYLLGYHREEVDRELDK